MLLLAGTTFGQSTPPRSAIAINSAAKPGSAVAIQYVSPEGDDSNNGSSWETAKRTVMAALRALAGGNSTTAGHGTVALMDGVNWSPIGILRGDTSHIYSH
jgi:hypothetical protein